MKKLLLILLIPFNLLLADGINNNKENENITPFNPFKPESQNSKVYYGGNVGLRFWNNYFYLGVYPMVGYKITPKLSIGAKIGYVYIRDRRYTSAYNSSNYGGSIFLRYRILPELYAHAEYVYFSYDHIISYNPLTNTFNTKRLWIPFLLLGGGYSQMISPNVWAFAEVLFDVINDPNSPYKSGDPFISVGVGVGF